MNPSFDNYLENDNIMHFRLFNTNVSLANAIRRTIVSDIPTLVFLGDMCNISVNTGRLHNELVKQRLGCTPIHSTDLKLGERYVMELDIQNNGDETLIVTSGDFTLKDKETNEYVSEDVLRRIFPRNEKTQMFIDFVRLRAKIGDSIPGEQIKLSCDIGVSTAKIDSMYNVASKCTYGNTIDVVKLDKQLDELHSKLVSEGNNEDEISFQKDNFKLLDAQRHFIKDSFDFQVQSVGVFDNKYLVRKACTILHDKMVDLITSIDSDSIVIRMSETTMENSYDIVLENEDYTIGKALEYILHEMYYLDEELFSFCGFKKFHPHDTESIIRIAYSKPTDENTLRGHLRVASIKAVEIFKSLTDMFKK